jgi:hypothetical protein
MSDFARPPGDPLTPQEHVERYREYLRGVENEAAMMDADVLLDRAELFEDLASLNARVALDHDGQCRQTLFETSGRHATRARMYRAAAAKERAV